MVDKGNNRVERFNSAGTFLSQFDGSAAPTGQFVGPEAIAVDNSTNPLDPSAGDVYVSDVGHKVIDKFTGEGTYIGQITAGEGAVAFGELLGVAVDPEGVVWVYHDASAEIDNFSDALANQFLTRRTLNIFSPSPGLAVDQEDNLYVVYNHLARIIEEFSSNGKILREEVGGRRGTTGSRLIRLPASSTWSRPVRRRWASSVPGKPWSKALARKISAKAMVSP